MGIKGQPQGVCGENFRTFLFVYFTRPCGVKVTPCGLRSPTQVTKTASLENQGLTAFFHPPRPHSTGALCNGIPLFSLLDYIRVFKIIVEI